jgi:hypothetical protein
MATWKRLTSIGGEAIDVNMDQVCYMVHSHPDETTIHFAGEQHLRIQGTAENIHSVPVVPSN